MTKFRWTGKKLGNRYLIEEMLGQGGMSAVYKASDPNLKRVVAIKMIHPHLSDDPDFVQRFEEEAAAVAQLRHPGIIHVYDFNKDDDVYYMVLEFVPGETFQDHLKRLNQDDRKLAIPKAIEYMAEICDAVDYAHERGLIHRDIKPANLMLNIYGQVILMDFGIVKIVGGQRHTSTGAVVGTAMYMSPEQIKGGRPDRRTDIYSLGVTLFEMVGGRPPFQADSAMTLMMMHVNDPVPDPRKLNPDVPDDLVTVINKALAKNPDDRFQTAAQMAAALRYVLRRIKSASSAAAPVPGATMLEASPVVKARPEETSYEPPPPIVDGTVVERPGTGTSGGGGNVRGTAIESSAVRPVPSPQGPVADAQPKKPGLSLPIIAGGLIGLACLIFGGIFLASRPFGGGAGNNPPTPTQEQVVIIANTEAPTLTAAPEMTATLILPTETSTETAIPFTPTPEGSYVVITGIRVQGNLYAVDYEVHNIDDSQHVHMFFNTVPPEQAGSPGQGPWKLTWGVYGNPPFTQYGIANRPPNATQMCSLVANANHSVILNSGNCVDLP
ncbi:MAG: protein kinase [Anaerolineae bacterium]|nr:protein kinase [Anaerolineae bacterium]MCI0611206.1 protein kinase [Anaerolineae bacterium]